MRATPLSSGRQGRIAKVDGSGMAIMSDSSIALKPVMEEPSKPMPPSKASSSSCALIEKLFSWPRMSVNQSRTKRMSRSSTNALISSAVCGWSLMARRLQPGVGPALERAHRRLERLTLRGEDVLDTNRCVVDDPALDDALRLELLHPLREQAIREIGDEPLELGEASRPVHEHEQDRARPALADQLHGPVILGAAGVPAYDDGPLRRHRQIVALRRLGEPGVLARPVLGHVARPRDEVSVGRERHVRDRLEDLLVLPAGLARLFLEMALRRAVGLEQRLDEPEQRRLALVIRVELARERNLIHAEPGVAAGALKRRERVLAALMLGDRQRDPLLGRVGQRTVAELGAEAGVGAEHRRRAGHDADEVRQLAAARERALENRHAALRGRLLVVDLEPALLGLHFRSALLSANDLRDVSLGDQRVCDAPVSARRAVLRARGLRG